MSNHRVLSDQYPCAQRSGAGTIRKIRLENFMCHSSLEIELCEWVNFITGQNGSGKSAILTALCIAFGCRAKETQRASKLNQFIKTGCSYAIVQVEIKNEGVDAFKPEIYGDTILIERRISDLTSSTALKDCRGKKVGSRKEDLRELVDHFNIDVENPCVIMSQDKSREFLHSGNDKDKFKFFFKATLLQQVDELLQSIKKQLNDAYALVDELENFIKPIQLELNELDGKIKNMERVEEISRGVSQLGKQLAWSWVYDYDRKLENQRKKIEVLKDRIPACQAKIDSPLHKLEKLRELFSEKKDQVACLVEKRADVKRREEELRNRFTAATKEKLELEGDYRLCSGQLDKMLNHLENLEQQANDIQEKHMRNTQAEQLEIEDQIKELENAVELVKSRVSSLKDEERILSERALDLMGVIQKLNDEIKEYEKKRDEIRHQVNELSRHQTNKVTAFGGDGVLRLLREIERHHHKFTMPPIGPIGAHVKLVKGADIWAPAVEQAIGRLLNAFIVTDPKDANTLRACGKDARYNYFQIVIYKFSRPRLDIPNHLLPQTEHPTILSVLHSDNPTVFNVLVDTGKVERIVLVKDYNIGRAVVFEQRIPNVAEVLTIDGLRMFSRGSVQTVLPSRRTFKIGRLSGSFDDQIEEFKREVSNFEEEIKQSKIRKRESEQKHQDFRYRLDDVKRRRLDIERDLTFKSMKLRDVQNSRTSEDTVSLESTANELLQEISNVENEIHRKKEMLERLQEKMNEAGAKAGNLKLSFEDLSESTKREIETFKKAEEELSKIENEIKNEEALKVYYEGLMNNKVLPDIKDAEAQYMDLENSRKESCQKASIICPESDINNLGDLGTPAELSAQLDRLNQRLKHERNRYSESIDDLRMLYQEKEHKILRKQQTYKGLREKLDACQEALNLRLNKFKRNAALLKRELTWQFNGHLGKKGISGQINVNYDEKALSVQVQMPQDASSSIVRDTRGLSGGERSFSTLCFTLALHDMTEAPFRAMDEFDVFMDAVSRKISLDTLVEFALRQGSQWIFITPHDISSVKQDERIKKQQMAAPRS